MYDVAVAPSGKVWASANTYYWPGSTCRLRFFAYAPRENDAYAFSGADAAGAPPLRCVIPAEAGEQKDLLVASTDGLPGDYHQAVSLTFRHALTAVRFVCGDDMRPGTIRRITLKEVCTSGVYDLGAAQWSSVDNPSAFVQELDTPTEGTADVPLTTGPQTFMMLPQTLPAGAEIEVLFNDGTEDHLLTASIGGTLWPMGKTVTYRISTTSINWVYTLEAKGPRPYSFRGEYDEYAVTSYRTHVVTGQQEPVAWSETYSLDGGKSWTDVPPRWTNGFVGSGEGSTKPRSYSLYVREQTPVIHNGAAEKLMNTPPKGTADRPWNLSNRTGADAVENTANCYVINGPGHYCFPPCLRQRHPQRSRHPGSLQFHQHQPLRAQAVRQLHQLPHRQALHRRGLCLPADVGGNPVAGRTGTGDGRPLSRRAGPGHHLVCRPPGDHQGGECGHRAEGRTRAGHLVVAHLGDFCRRGADHPREDVPREGSIRACLRVHAGQPRLVRDGRSGVPRASMCRPSRHSPAVRS